MEKERKKWFTVAVIAVMVAASMGLVMSIGSPRHLETMNISGASILGSNPYNVKMNVTLNGVSYLNEPTQYKWGGPNGTYTGESFVKNGDWVTNNSGYQMFIVNSTVSAQSSPAIASFSMGSSLGSNASFFYTDSRVALNETGTFYYVLSENKQTAAPGTAGLTGAASDTIFLKAVWDAGTSTYTLTYGYYNASGLHTGSLSTGMEPLTFYEIFFNVESNSAQITVELDGKVIDTSASFTTNMSGILSSKLTSTLNLYDGYMYSAGANANMAGMVLDFGYLVDHDVYTAARSLSSNYSAVQTAGVVSSTLSTVTPFDPATVSSEFLGAPNATSNFGNTFVKPTVNVGTDWHLLPSGSNASANAAFLNRSFVVNNLSKTKTMSAIQAYTTAALINETGQSVKAQITQFSWTAKNVNAAISVFLKNYIAGKLAKEGYSISPSQITVANYLVSQIGIDQLFSNHTATSMRDYMYNAYAGLLKDNNLSLVNTTTNAIAAGSGAGDFFVAGMAVHPSIQNGMIVNPITGAKYSSLQAAGFAAGTYIADGAVIVPSYTVLGFSGGIPAFGTYGFSWPSLSSITGSLTAAGSAVGNFFQGAGSSVGSALNTVKNSTTDYVVKPLSTAASNAVSSLNKGVGQVASTVSPVIGGAVSSISTAVSGIGTAVKSSANDLGSVAHSTVSSIMAGANNVKTDVMSIGHQAVSGAKKAIYDTAGTLKNASVAVASPIYSSMRNLVNFSEKTTASIDSKLVGAIHEGQHALDSVGNSVLKWANGTYHTVTNGLGAVAHDISGAGGAIVNGATGIAHWFESVGATLGHVLMYVGIGVLVVVVALVIIWALTRGPRTGLEGARNL